MKRKFINAVLIASSILLVCLLSYSQIRETGIILGHVSYEGKSLPGVTVTLEGAKLIGGTRSLQVDSKGFYKFPLLIPGEYKVKALLSGFKTVIKERIRLHANTTVTVDIKMTVAKLDEEIVVEAISPMVDVKSSSTGGVVITEELLNALPVNKNEFANIINLAPGIINDVAHGTGGQHVNSWQIDGVEMTDPKSGGIALFRPDFNIIEEVNVRGLGLPAEYGDYTGAVVTATTKSGGNKFSIFNEIRFNGENWNSQNRNKIPAEEWPYPTAVNEEVQTQQMLAIGSQVGYKIIHDKLWFFLSAEYTKTNYWNDSLNADSNQMRYKGFLKLTYQLNSSNKLNASSIYSYQYQLNPGGGGGIASIGGGGIVGGGIGGIFAQWEYGPGVGHVLTRPSVYVNTNWTSILSSTAFLQTKLAFNYLNRIGEPQKGRDIPGHRDRFLKLYTENYPSFSNYDYKKFQARSHLSKFIPNFLGSHDMKIGIELSFDRTFQTEGYPGGIRYDDYNGEPHIKHESEPLEHDHYLRTFVGFFQDSWEVTKKLVINLGVRFSNYSYRIPEPGRGVIYKASNLSPRIGLVFDIFGNRKTLFKLHYGLIHEALLGDFFIGMETRYNEKELYFWDAETQDWILQSSNLPWIENYDIDDTIKQPCIHEITGGFERELFRNASLSVNFYYRALANPIGSIDIGSEWQPITVVNPGPDGIEGTSDDLGTFEAYDIVALYQRFYFITNPKKGMFELMVDDPKRVATGLQVIFNKRFSKRWQAIVSYNYSIVKGNSTGSIFSLISPNELITPYGEARPGLNYPTHMFKLQGNFLLPLDINLGVIGVVRTSHPVIPSFQYKLPVYGNWSFMAGELGEYSTDSGAIFSLRAEKIFKLKKGRVSYALDVNNVFNNPHPVGRSYQFGFKFLKVSGVQFPRTLMMTIRFSI